MRGFRLRALGVAFAALIAALFAVTGTASAGTAAGAGRATAYQNSVIAKVMAEYPGGVRVSASTVEWNGGAAYVSVPVSSGAKVDASADLCTPGYFCYWTGSGFSGTENGCVDSDLQGGPWFCSRGFAFNLPPIESYVNDTPYRSWLQQNNSHTSAGNELCISAGVSNSDLTGVNTTDRWVWMSNNSAPC